jgi:hypothetical protein
LCLRLLSARTLTALRSVLLQAQRKVAIFFLPDSMATGCGEGLHALARPRPRERFPLTTAR